MYPNDPSTAPGPVASGAAKVVASGTSGAITFATPKSRTFTCPDSVTMTLAGLMSRCTMPAAWAASSAPAICSRIPEHVGQRQTAGTDAAVERFAGQELHHDEVDAVVLVDFIDGDDIGMIECGRGARLLDEPLTPVRVGHVPDHLQRDRPIEARIDRAIDDAHAAGANALDEPVVRQLLRAVQRAWGRWDVRPHGADGGHCSRRAVTAHEPDAKPSNPTNSQPPTQGGHSRSTMSVWELEVGDWRLTHSPDSSAHPHSSTNLLAPQGDERIDSGGSPGRQETGNESDGSKQDGCRNVRGRIA